MNTSSKQADLPVPNGHNKELTAAPGLGPAGQALPELDALEFLPQSFFGGGFECATFIRRSGRRLDLIDATRHDRFALLDYERLNREGMHVAREGVRWHLAEPVPGRYDFSSALSVVRAARSTGTQVIWDLCHFGWPDGLDVFSTEFAERLAAFGAAFASWLANETNGPACFVPVNEISYFSWAAAEEGSMYPFVTGRGAELKRNLVRAAIMTIQRIREVDPAARFMHVDPVIHVVAKPNRPDQKEEAEAYRRAQFQALEMICGREAPELGGRPEFLDAIGVNFYRHNQWFYNLRGHKRVGRFSPISRRHPLYRPFRDMLNEVFVRYPRPIYVAETGAESRLRAGWLRYVCEEVSAAIQMGVPVRGVCLYPILNHPGWEDDRHCHNGLWDYHDEHGHREIYAPLARELRRWVRHFSEKGAHDRDQPSGNTCLESIQPA